MSSRSQLCCLGSSCHKPQGAAADPSTRSPGRPSLRMTAMPMVRTSGTVRQHGSTLTWPSENLLKVLRDECGSSRAKRSVPERGTAVVCARGISGRCITGTTETLGPLRSPTGPFTQPASSIAPAWPAPQCAALEEGAGQSSVVNLKFVKKQPQILRLRPPRRTPLRMTVVFMQRTFDSGHSIA
jgi:hypothetical protein